jgi:hypothetical protein
MGHYAPESLGAAVKVTTDRCIDEELRRLVPTN